MCKGGIYVKKTIMIKNLDCANCAAKLESKINKIKKVDNAVVNFLTQKIIVEAKEEDFDIIIDEIKKIVSKNFRECSIDE